MTSVKELYQEINIPASLNPQSISDLTKELSECEKEQVRFVVLNGSDKVFCDGLDLTWVANSKNDHAGEMQSYAGFLRKIQTGKFISIAQVKGSVSGGGMGIVCACDHVIASESSTYSLPEGLLGLIPGLILPSLLNRLSAQRIKKMVLTGKKYSAATALEYGIIDEITNDHKKALNDAITNMRSCKPGAVADIKTLLYSSHTSKDAIVQSGIHILTQSLKILIFNRG